MNQSTIITSNVSMGKYCLKYASINLIAVFLISALILYGWVFEIDNLVQPLPGFHPMNPVTALSFIFSAVSIVSLLILHNFHRLLLLRAILSAFIILIGLMGLLIYFRVIAQGVHQSLVSNLLNIHNFNNRPVLMAPNTAFSFVLSGIAIYFMDKRSVLPIYISLVIGLISFLSLTGYIHQEPGFYGGSSTPMAISTSVCFLFLSSSILLLERENGFMALITSNESSGRIARLLLPMCLVTPVLTDVLRLYGENLGLYDPSFGKALCSMVITTIFIYVTWKALKFINEINQSLENEILERGNAEIELKRANTFLGKILDNIPDMVFVKQGPELRFLNVNKVGERVLGMTEEFMVGKNDYELFPKHIADTFRQKDMEVMQTGETLVIDEEPIVRGGTERWLRTKKIAVSNENGEPWYMIGISEDITESKNQADKIRRFYAELEQKVQERTEELSKSEYRFRAMLENGNDFISMIDPSLKIIYQSPALERMTGYSPKERMDEPVFKYAHPEDIEKLMTLYNVLLANPRKTLPLQYQMLTKAGNYIWVEGTIINLIDDESVKAIVANFRNVTERKKHEDEREKLIIELVQHNKDLQQFSYITSHNLRAPIANLLGLLSIIDEHPIESTEHKNIIKDIERSTNFLDATITDLVSVVNIKNSPSARLDNIELTEIFSKIITQVSVLLKQKQAEIHFDFKKYPQVYFNRSYLESILQNLLTNSLKYSSPERAPVINVYTEEINNQVHLVFSDNGLGIDTERYKERLFGLYQRFHPGFEGKGLGLYLVKSQMEALNGEIEIESHIGKGTTIILKFKIPERSS